MSFWTCCDILEISPLQWVDSTHCLLACSIHAIAINCCSDILLFFCCCLGYILDFPHSFLLPYRRFFKNLLIFYNMQISPFSFCSLTWNALDILLHIVYTIYPPSPKLVVLEMKYHWLGYLYIVVSKIFYLWMMDFSWW